MSMSARSESGWELPRWRGITRVYKTADIERLQGTSRTDYSLARAAAEKLWRLLQDEESLRALGARTGDEAVKTARAGLKAIYLDGLKYSDQSFYAEKDVPNLVRSINMALTRADQVAHADGQDSIDWMLPIVADAEAGFGGVPNAFGLMKSMIEAGAAAVVFDDQLSYAKKCGHMGGKVLVPTRDAIHKLIAARLAADILGVPTVLIARTEASGAQLIASDCDPDDAAFLTGERTIEGFFTTSGGIDAAIARGLAYAPYADMLWCETSEPNLAEARRFARAIHAEFPGKLLAYNCSSSFHWRAKLDEWDIARFQDQLAAMGYRCQFVAQAGSHTLNLSTFGLAHEYAHTGMPAYSQFQ